jgi:serine/threonine protein kinase
MAEPFAGRWELEEQIHAGAMARVYRARDARTGESVAVKVPVRDDETELQRFRQEGEILASFDHPGIVRYVAHESLAIDATFVATEWLAGETLFARLRRGRLTFADAASVVRHITAALDAVHRARVVHRDVKPTNVMLCRNGTGTKLLDFGIARRDPGGGLISHASFGGGTWAYMSPEQVMGAAELGARTDVFSLGCVLFECVTGKRAYPSDRSAAIVAKVWRDPPKLASFCRDASPRLAELLSRMLAKDPLARPPDASALLSELDALGELPESPAELL